MAKLTEYKEPAQLKRIKEKFWKSAGYNKLETQNWGIVEQAIEYAYRTVKDE